MRAFVLALMGILSVLFCTSLAAGVNIAGIQADVALLVVVCVAVLDQTSAPILFAAATGLFMDILIGAALGVYALGYTAAAAAVMLAFRKAGRFNFFMLFGAGAGGYLLKELVMAVVAYALGARFDIPHMLTRCVLPAAALNGGLALAAYLPLSRLFRLGRMRPRARHEMDDFGKV